MKGKPGLLYLIFIVALLLPVEKVFSQSYVEGALYYGRNGYIVYQAGGLPLIISVPHGGNQTPAEIPDRTCGLNATDSYTYELAGEISAELLKLTGCYPHIIFNRLKRIKLDANRDLAEATCGDAEAEIAWFEYHRYIDSAKVASTRKFGKGLFIDLHGQSSHGPRIELGYLISGSELALSDATLNTSIYKDKSSIRNLINYNASSLTFSELLRGDFSLGTMIQDKGFTAVPSKYTPSPEGDFYNGGYNTLRHGSKLSGTTDAIQMECNYEIRGDETVRQAFAKEVAGVLLEYLKKHFIPNLDDYYCNIVSVSETISDQYRYFPNPVKDNLHISNVLPAEVQLINLFGELVFSETDITETDISLGYLPNGLYIILFKQNGEIVNRGKIIISQRE